MQLSCNTLVSKTGSASALSSVSVYIGASLFPLVCHGNLPPVSQLDASMNSTSDIVGWTSEPQGRGTLGLLWSCFATIFLCTWSAIHPNLPASDDSKSTIFWRRIKHLFLCLLVPEGYAIDALFNFVAARSLQTKVCCAPNRSNRPNLRC